MQARYDSGLFKLFKDYLFCFLFTQNNSETKQRTFFDS